MINRLSLNIYFTNKSPMQANDVASSKVAWKHFPKATNLVILKKKKAGGRILPPGRQQLCATKPSRIGAFGNQFHNYISI